MDIKKLHFFDKQGYDLNFTYDNVNNWWEGNIYLPPVSVGLYSNTSIFILEEIEVPVRSNLNKKHTKSSETETIFVFPRTTKELKEKVTFRWDTSNTFIDEIFMFTFDDTYVPNRHSSLSYSYNDGPDCKTLLVNRFDRYEVNLDYISTSSKFCKRVLPIHVGFSSPTQFDGNTFKRTLIMSYNNKDIAHITFFAESVEEDERLKTWTYNLGYNIKPEDTIIFKNSDIEEPQPNYIMLNEKRKEILIEGHNIYPYIGSYRALLGAIKFFGYDNLNIIEFWRCINPDDDNYGKMIMSPKYVLSNKENTFVKDSKIDFPNPNYRKGNKLAFAYSINTPTGDVDLYELPYVKEEFNYSFNEILIKLYALRKKLNSEFLPSTSKIIDIIGEASYFGIQLIKNGFSFSVNNKDRDPINLDIDVYPNKIINISNDKFFNDFIIENLDENYITDTSSTPINDTVLNNIKDIHLIDEKTNQDNIKLNQAQYTDISKLDLTETEKCDLFKKYHDAISFTFTHTEDVIDNDTHELKLVPDNLISYDDNVLLNKNPNPEKEDMVYSYKNTLGNSISAKVILSNRTFRDKTFNDLPYPFKYVSKTFNDINTLDDFQYEWEQDKSNIELEWKITFSQNQIDECGHDFERKQYFQNILDKKIFENNNFYTHEPVLNEILNSKKDLIRFDNSYPKKSLVGYDTIPNEMTTFKAIKRGSLDDMNEVFFELPYIGYYDVTLTMYKTTTDYRQINSRYGKKCFCGDDCCEICNNKQDKKVIIKNSKTYKKLIKVEPHDIDIRGFYYDPKKLPDNLDTKFNDINEQKEMESYILDTLNYLTYIAQHDSEKINYKSNEPGGYDLQMVMNKHMNKINEKRHYYNINNGPFAKQNFKFADYLIQDGEFVIDNINKDIINLIPTLETSKYIHNGVCVNPYTWIYLTYDYSKIVYRRKPVWTLINKTTGKKITYTGKYLTCLLRHEGDYYVYLTLEDVFGNKYETKKHIINVRKNVDYNLYTPFKHEYMFMRNYINHKKDISNKYKGDIEKEKENDLSYIFSFNDLKEYDYENFIHSLNREKPKHTSTVILPYKNDESDVRISIKPGRGIGWGFDEPINIKKYNYLKIDMSDYYLTGNDKQKDNFEIYIVKDNLSYYHQKITDSNTIINLKDNNINSSDICYIIFFNLNDTKSNNNVEICFEKLKTDEKQRIRFTYI